LILNEYFYAQVKDIALMENKKGTTNPVDYKKRFRLGNGKNTTIADNCNNDHSF